MASKSAQQEPEKAEVIEELLDQLDTSLDRVKVLYEQYFLGIQKQPPTHVHGDLERKIRDLSQMQIRNTALRYRYATLSQKFGSYNTYWRRTLRQIENGTYIRQLSKVGRHAAKTGAEVPEEILAQMPKRMRERVKRDREAALAMQKVREQHQSDELLTLAEEEMDDDDVAAFIKESTDLRKNMLTETGAIKIDPSDAEFDVDAFFASVIDESAPDPVLPSAPPMSPMPRASSDVETSAPRIPRTIAPDDERTEPRSVVVPRPAAPASRATPPAGQPVAPPRRVPVPAGLPVAPTSRATPPAGQQTQPMVPTSRATPPAGQPVAPPRPTVPANRQSQPVVPPVIPPIRLTPAQGSRTVAPSSPPPQNQTQAIPRIPTPASLPLRPIPAPPKIPVAPSQLTRPIPVIPGSMAATQPVPVETMSGPFAPVDAPKPTPPVAKPTPPAPAAAKPAPPRPQRTPKPLNERTPPPEPQTPPPGMSDADVNALYAKYVKAKEMIGEPAGPGAYGKLLKTINAQAPKIMEQYKSKGVDFSIVVKDNQVIIRAKPK